MTENEIKEEIKELHRKAKIFENSGYATAGISFTFKKSARIIHDLLTEIQQYRAIGTVEDFKALKEKSVAKKPVYAPTDDSCLYSEYVCPNCHIRLPHFRQKYCQCGQKLDC